MIEARPEWVNTLAQLYDANGTPGLQDDELARLFKDLGSGDTVSRAQIKGILEKNRVNHGKLYREEEREASDVRSSGGTNEEAEALDESSQNHKGKALLCKIGLDSLWYDLDLDGNEWDLTDRKSWNLTFNSVGKEQLKSWLTSKD